MPNYILIKLNDVISYCTKGMLDKIPEGDWVCKDCELEERNNQAKDKLGSADGNDPDVQGNKTDKDCSSVKISRKRNADDAEVSSVAKRQALEPTIGSPKTSSPIKVGVLSRDSSFKNLDKGKVRPAHQFPHGIHAVNDTPETASPTLGTRQQTPRGKSLVFTATLFAKLLSLMICPMIFFFLFVIFMVILT